MSDYISRGAITEWRPKKIEIFNSRAYIDLEELLALVDGIPAADVEPVVRANWQLLSGSPGTFRCSNCGAEFEENPYAKCQRKWTGCPVCRAKMQMIMDLEETK